MPIQLIKKSPIVVNYAKDAAKDAATQISLASIDLIKTKFIIAGLLIVIPSVIAAIAISGLGKSYAEAASRQPEIMDDLNIKTTFFAALTEAFIAIAVGCGAYLLFSTPSVVDPATVKSLLV